MTALRSQALERLRWLRAEADRHPGRAAIMQLGRRSALAILVTAAMAAPGRATAGQEETAPPQLATAVHVHSTASSGNQTLLELARTARTEGVDAIVLAENLGYEFRYAPPLLRWLFEARMAGPTLEAYGIERFLAELGEARRAMPETLLLAGVEVPPYYYWTGDPLADDLTLHDMQRNVLVVPPVDDPETVADLLRGLPAVGNRHHRRLGVGSVGLVLPGLALVVAAFAALRRRGALRPASYAPRYLLDESQGRYVRRRGRQLDPANGLLFAVLVGGLALLYANFPYTAPLLSPYSPESAPAVHTNLLDYASAGGALTFWSMPEARDRSRRAVGPFEVSTSTHPDAELVGRFEDHTGFGGVYADTVSIWHPGSAWDEALTAFLEGRRPRAPWLIGESAFHYSGQAGKQLGDVLTVSLATDRTPEALFAALQHGHAYALRRTESSADLRLLEFALAPIGEPAVDVARMGESLEAGGSGVEVTLAVDDLRGDGTRVDVEIVRNGSLHRRFDGTTPLERRWREDETTEDAYYRVIVSAVEHAYLVSNPVFVRRTAAIGQ